LEGQQGRAVRLGEPRTFDLERQAKGIEVRAVEGQDAAAVIRDDAGRRPLQQRTHDKPCEQQPRRSDRRDDLHRRTEDYPAQTIEHRAPPWPILASSEASTRAPARARSVPAREEAIAALHDRLDDEARGKDAAHQVGGLSRDDRGGVEVARILGALVVPPVLVERTTQALDIVAPALAEAVGQCAQLPRPGGPVTAPDEVEDLA